MSYEYFLKYLPQILDIAIPLLLLALTWGAAEVARFVRGRTRSGAVQDAILRLNDAAYAVVAQMAQGTAGSLKAAAADGKLTPDEIQAIKLEAYNAVISYIGHSGRMELIDLFGSSAMETMIKAKLEQAVLDMKSTPVGVGGQSEPD